MTQITSELKSLFTKEAENYGEVDRKTMLEALIFVQKNITTLIIPQRMDKKGEELDIEMPFSVAAINENIHVLAHAHSIDNVKFGDISQGDWVSFNQMFAHASERKKYKEAHSLRKSSDITVVQLNPNAYSVGECTHNGIVTLVRPVPLRLN